jgi:hypothetical protein
MISDGQTHGCYISRCSNSTRRAWSCAKHKWEGEKSEPRYSVRYEDSVFRTDIISVIFANVKVPPRSHQGGGVILMAAIISAHFRLGVTFSGSV